MAKQQITSALQSITNGKLGDHLEYIVDMVMEEPESTPEELKLLIGDFLADVEYSDSEAEYIYIKLYDILKLIDNDSKIKEYNNKLDTPVTIQNISKINDSFQDPYLGIEGHSVNFNSSMPIAESVKVQRAIEKERQRQQKLFREWESAKIPLPPPACKHADIGHRSKVTDIIVKSFSVSVGGRELLRDSQLKLCIGRKYGLVGRNGIGKSTFLGALARWEIPGVNRDLHILHIEQEITGTEDSALETVLECDSERTELLIEEKNLSKKSTLTEVEGNRLAIIFQRLEAIDSSTAESRASSILSGLGFTTEMQKKSTKAFSGGWRMRVALARALFADPDILLLDEPTNHLDLHAVCWLTSYLQNWEKTCIIVSHARNFLNDVCSDIIHFSNFELEYYSGDYDTFDKVRCERLRQNVKQFETQQSKVAQTKKFIDKFRCNAKRAALVQSRIKMLSKMPMLEEMAQDPQLVFTFSEPEKLPTTMLLMNDVNFAYPAKDRPGETGSTILKGVNLSIEPDSRIAVCGVNGSGKSTLLKLLIAQLEPTAGYVTRHNKLRIGFFSQHHVDGLDLCLNAVQSLQTKYPGANVGDEAARTFLGKFGLSGMLSLEPLYILSGGQKSRVAIALMAFNNPHILVLDEPTNHLDLDAVQALIAALSTFEGGVVIVSHDAHLVGCVCDEIWNVDAISHTCEKFHGDFEEYKKAMSKSVKA
eukprot:GHVL01010833.1.p1 GENE.GHVL01010833.1~~GHVL01010833.1.p1  ORF type:complete len:707 (+),score=140.26 GHVL01010833.1:39-2159(+)